MNPWKVDGDELVFACGCKFPVLKKFDDPERMPMIKFNRRRVVFCQATKDLFASGKTKGVFQLEKQLGQTWAKRLKPETKEQVSGLVSILRPGTLKSKREDGVTMTQQYCSRKNGKEEVESYHPVVDEVLKDSFGTMIYQEQSMKLAVECASYSPTEADSLRRCLTGDTRFLSESRGWLTIEELIKDDLYKKCRFLTVDDRGESVYVPIKDIWETGERPVKRVMIENGMSVKATKNHEFLTVGGWKRRDELMVGDKLLVSSQANLLSEVRPDIANIFSECLVKFERGHVKLTHPSLERLRVIQLELSQSGIFCSLEDFSTSLTIECLVSLNIIAKELGDGDLTNKISVYLKGRKIPKIEFLPEKVSKIVSIKGGTERVKVYDFTVDHPDFPFLVANGLRVHNSIGKKDAQEMAKNKLLFIEKAEQSGIISKEQAVELFDWIEKSNRYSFNHCISSDTKILRVAKGKYKSEYSVEEMYKIRHDIRYAEATGDSVLRRKYMRLGYGLAWSMNPDGRIRPNKIVDIKAAGVRAVYKLTLDNGASIRVTNNHRFPTPSGEKRLDELVEGQEMFVCGPYEKTDFGPINSYSKITRKEILGRVSNKAVNGCFGEENCMYTNGSYTEYIKNKELLPINCELCGKGPGSGRMECHHKNGDRSNSSLENLQKLCVSCHKKEQYRLGRTKRGEKGYPTLTAKVVSIVPDGECETYDVEMEASNHNFVVSSGIVTCNSHAWSYGLRSIKTAYLKAHFPLLFFANWLKFAHTKQDQEEEAYELVEDAKTFGVKVLAPDIRHRNTRVAIKNQKIVFGMADVSGVGEKFVEKLLSDVAVAEKRLGKIVSDFSWPELLMEVLYIQNSKAIDGLVCCGAFSFTGVPRLRQRNEYLVLHRLKTKKTLLKWLIENREKGDSLLDTLKKSARMKKDGGGCHSQQAVEEVMDEISLLENPPTPEIDVPQVIATFEEKLLGVAVSCSLLESCDLSGANSTCAEMASGERDFGNVGVILTRVHQIITKVDREMAFITAVDQTGTLQDIVVFSDLYEEHKSILREGNTLLFGLEVGRNGDGFVVKSLSQI